jgi:hypothetical protein
MSVDECDVERDLERERATTEPALWTTVLQVLKHEIGFRRDRFFELIVVIMTSRVKSGVDIKYAQSWKSRLAYLKANLSNKHGFQFRKLPDADRVKTAVKQRLEIQCPQGGFIFTVQDFTRAIAVRYPSLLDEGLTSQELVAKLLATDGAIGRRTALLQDASDFDPVKFESLVRDAFARKADRVEYPRDKLNSAEIEKTQKDKLVQTEHPDYVIKTSWRQQLSVNLFLVEKQSVSDEERKDHNDSDQAEFVLRFNSKTSASPQLHNGQYNVAFSNMFAKDDPVVIDLFQCQGGQVRFYASLLVKSPQSLKQALGEDIKSDNFTLSFTVSKRDGYFFEAIQFDAKLLEALAKCDGGYELRHVRDEVGSTPASLEDARWKIDRLASWIDVARLTKQRIADVESTSATGRVGDNNEELVLAVLSGCPNLRRLDRSSYTAAKEDLRLSFHDQVFTVSVRTAYQAGRKLNAKLMVKCGRCLVPYTYSTACDLFCFVSAGRCFFISKHDAPLRQALEEKKSWFSWNKGELDHCEIAPGEPANLEGLLCRLMNMNTRKLLVAEEPPAKRVKRETIVIDD